MSVEEDTPNRFFNGVASRAEGFVDEIKKSRANRRSHKDIIGGELDDLGLFISYFFAKSIHVLASLSASITGGRRSNVRKQ